MKRISTIFYLSLTTAVLLFSSCTQDEMMSEEYVAVNFCAELPNRIGTRAGGVALNVNQVVCAVFEDGMEISTLREVIEIQEGQEIVFAPRLIKGRTYDIVFWAMKDNNYDVDDMTAITRNSESTATENGFDAFTESVEIQVTGSKSETVTLTRPLAQLNIAVTKEDWDTVVEKFSMTPTTMTITINGKHAFNALKGVATGEDEKIIYNLQCSGDDLTVNNTTYKSIASCYVLPEERQENFDITYTVKDQNSSAIRSSVIINNVPLQANYKTNVVGGLLTGIITYNISIQEGFNQEEHNRD